MKSLGARALFLSFFIHLAAFAGFFGLPGLNQSESIQNKPRKIEIINRPLQNRRTPLQRYSSEQNTPPSYQEEILDRLIQTNSALKSQNNFEKEITKKVRGISLANLIEEEELKKNPAYMNYYRKIREEIRKKAYKAYQGRAQGKVYLNFNLEKNGNLQLVELKNPLVQSQQLQQIALASVKASAPFPPFPEELKNHNQLQFNISIQFKNN